MNNKYRLPRTGFEPARDCSHQPLKLARLPNSATWAISIHKLLIATTIVPAFAGISTLFINNRCLSILNSQIEELGRQPLPAAEYASDGNREGKIGARSPQ
jgi:hypothetical protein